MPRRGRPRVAVFNTNDDLVALIRVTLEDEGYGTVCGKLTEAKRGKLDLAAFLARHTPAVVIYDIAAPFDESWAFYERLRDAGTFDQPVVLTTGNLRALTRVAGAEGPVLEIVGQDEDLGALLDRVNQLIRGRR